MKKIVCIAAVFLCLAVLCGCAAESPKPYVTNPPVTAAPPPATEAPTPEPTPEPTATPEPASVFDQEKYDAAVAALLEEYRSILPFDPENYDEDAHPEIPWYSAILLRYEENTVYYGFFDFDENGTKELVIALGNEDAQQPMGIYAFDGEKMVYLCKEQALGERASVSFDNGVFSVRGSGGAAVGTVIDYKIGADGFSTEIINEYDYEFQEDGSVKLTVRTGEMAEDSFDAEDLGKAFDVPIEYSELVPEEA